MRGLTHKIQTTFTILLPIKDLDTKEISIHNQESQGPSL